MNTIQKITIFVVIILIGIGAWFGFKGIQEKFNMVKAITPKQEDGRVTNVPNTIEPHQVKLFSGKVVNSFWGTGTFVKCVGDDKDNVIAIVIKDRKSGQEVNVDITEFNKFSKLSVIQVRKGSKETLDPKASDPMWKAFNGIDASIFSTVQGFQIVFF